MSNRNKIIQLLTFSLILLFTSCKWDRPSASNSDNAPPVMEQEELAEISREDWQRPELVVSKFGDLQDKTVVDIGAGLGFFLVYLVPKVNKLIAVDIDENATQWLTLVKSQYPTELQGKIDIRLVEPDDPKLAKDEVDAVLIVNTIAYIEDRVSYLSYLRQAIKKDGIIQIVDFKMETLDIEAPPMMERLDPFRLASELEEAGYTVTERDYSSLKYQYSILASDPD